MTATTLSITSVSIDPNPVGTGRTYILAVGVEEMFGTWDKVDDYTWTFISGYVWNDIAGSG